MVSEATRAVKGSEAKRDGIVTLSTGVRVKFKPVSALLIQNARRQVKDPTVPKEPNPDKDGEMTENPWHPDYIKAMKEADERREDVTFDVTLIMGLELVDGMPPDEEWLPAFKLLIDRKFVDVSRYDLNDPVDKELVYKRFVAMGNNDWLLLNKASGLVSAEGVQDNLDLFRDNQERDSDTASAGPA